MSLINLSAEQFLEQKIMPRILQQVEQNQLVAEKPKSNSLLSQPGLSQALLNLGSTVAMADSRGMGLGQSLALGAGQFANTLQANRERIEAEREKANEKNLAAMMDILQLKASIEEANLNRQNVQSQMAARAADREYQMQLREEKAAQLEAQRAYLEGQGIDPALVGAFPEQAMSQAFATPKERKMEKDVNGTLRYVDTGEEVFSGVEKVEDPKDFNNDMRQAAGFASRMEDSNSVLASMENEGEYGINWTADRLGGGLLTNKALSEEQQVYRNAAEDWVRSKLRKESGAVIGDEEMKSEIKTYFPQPGDSEKVIQQKARKRQIATASMIESAGGAYKPTAKTIDVPNDIEGTKTIGGVKYIKKGGEWYTE